MTVHSVHSTDRTQQASPPAQSKQLEAATEMVRIVQGTRGFFRKAPVQGRRRRKEAKCSLEGVA